jgi:hypothetical protein
MPVFGPNVPVPSLASCTLVKSLYQLALPFASTSTFHVVASTLVQILQADHMPIYAFLQPRLPMLVNPRMFFS